MQLPDQPSPRLARQALPSQAAVDVLISTNLVRRRGLARNLTDLNVGPEWLAERRGAEQRRRPPRLRASDHRTRKDDDNGSNQQLAPDHSLSLQSGT
jgi:hypothetical protein